MELLQPFLGRGQHWVFTDNFYTSPELYMDLLEHKTYATGTVRPHRKHFPLSLKTPTKMDIGSYQFASCQTLLAARWHDRRDVYMLSTAHDQSVSTVMKRPKGSKSKQPIPCPICIQDYNLYMGGVDLTDQCLSYYSLTQRRTVKWWKKVFWRLVDMTILNSWIIFRTNWPTSEINSHRLFRLELINKLVQPLLSKIASPDGGISYSKGRRPSSCDRRLLGKHFPYTKPNRSWCVVCYQNKTPTGARKDTKTRVFCPKCGVYLCIGECFEFYHTRSKY